MPERRVVCVAYCLANQNANATEFAGSANVLRRLRTREQSFPSGGRRHTGH